jgi:hypothetical protein
MVRAMKNTIFIILILLSNFHLVMAADRCDEAVDTHMEVINKSEFFIATIAPHSNKISSYEITLLQKNLTARYVDLKNTLAVCNANLLSKAVAIYDYNLFGDSIFANTDLRRVVLGFIKYKPYSMDDFLENYKKFTANDFVQSVDWAIQGTGTAIPEVIKLETKDRDYDPNLYALSDKARNGTMGVVAGVARTWGFISDHAKWRHGIGYLNENGPAKELLLFNLKPLDLIFEKRTFVLSNYTIPGHWGHVGVWLGSKEELIAMNVWNQEYFKPFQKYVEEGRQIIEIRKQGLGFQSLDTFLNLDEIAVTRVNGVLEHASDVYHEMSEQIEKRYDFKFDARTAEKITCAEMIAFSYGDIKWHETKTLFQINLRPDDLAELSLDQKASEFILYLKGKEDGSFEQLGFDAWSELFKPKK